MISVKVCKKGPFLCTIISLNIFVWCIYQEETTANFYAEVLEQVLPTDVEQEKLWKYSRNKDKASYLNPDFDGTCTRPETRVVFLKVHKAGSSTVQNIFLRYGDSHNLNIVLPRTTEMNLFVYLGFEGTIDKNRVMQIPENETFQILCNHAIYNKKIFDEIMGPNTVKIGILREPVSQWTSAAIFYGFTEYLRELLGEYLDEYQLLSAFLEDPDIYQDCPHTHNSMFEDLGLHSSDFENQTAIEKYLRFLDDDLALVMLMEYFDESLVLMRRLLCWDIKDILYVPLNKNPEKARMQANLTSKDKRSLAQYNYPDFQLYIHFKEKFFKKIQESDNSFFSEVEYFQEIRETVTDYCRKSKLTDFTQSYELKIAPSIWNQAFVVTADECKFMTTEEEDLLKQLMKKANEKFKHYF